LVLFFLLIPANFNFRYIRLRFSMASLHRRSRDALCLNLLRGLESGASVDDLQHGYAEAGLASSLPTSVDSHSRAELERIAATMGVTAAKKIEAALNGGSKGKASSSTNNGDRISGSSSHVAGLQIPSLSEDPGFQQYMAVRFQLAEGTQVSTYLCYL
jgi:hypothetical protein